MDQRILNIFRYFPMLCFLFTCWVCYLYLIIHKSLGIIFVFLTFQFYTNWILAVVKNNPWVKYVDPPRIHLVGHHKLWFCVKCNQSGPFNVHHCPLCKKCIEFRDHHCFFLGVCINHRNVKHFIFILFYTVFICTYAMIILFPYLCKEFQKENVLSNWDLVVKFFYPTMFVQWLLGKEELFLVCVTITFNILLPICLTCGVYVSYQMYRILTGKMFVNFFEFVDQLSMWENYENVFGRWGIVNLLLPIPSFDTPLNFRDNQPFLISKYN